jgi:isoquinoline 1-oxidoreductase
MKDIDVEAMAAIDPFAGEELAASVVSSGREGAGAAGGGISRRRFMQVLGAGLLVAVTREGADAAAPGGAAAGGRGAARGGGGRGGAGRGGGGFGGGGSTTVSARLHIGQDGAITVMSGKVEGGQGARAEITSVVAEELRVPIGQITVILGDTDLVPDDGPTVGSGTTPRTIPAIRQAAAGARSALIALAASKWGVAPADVQANEGKVTAGLKSATYGELVGGDSNTIFAAQPAANVTVTAVSQWKVMGTPVLRNDRKDMVTGSHQYPSDITVPGMLYGKILRAPSYGRAAGSGAPLVSIDMTAATKLPGVLAFRDGDFVGVAAPTNFQAEAALAALAATAKWNETSTLTSKTLYADLLAGSPNAAVNPYAADVASAAKSVKGEYHVAYIQHAPLEPRAAVAQWSNGKMTVWTGTQMPFGVKTQVASALGISAAAVRVIVPDFGGGFGGKHQGDAAVEAARLARGINRPVWIRWTREEEFTWAYFRPAAVIVAEGGLDAQGQITSWHYASIGPGGAGVASPYNIRGGRNQSTSLASRAPLREGSYRGIGATANHFGREVFMDELATAAGIDPLTFRLNHISDPRLQTVLQTAATRAGFADKWKNKQANMGIGLACGTEKGGYLATCAQVTVDRKSGTVKVNKVTEVFECGAIVNPHGLLSQVTGAIVMGLGAAIREEIMFDKGQITNGTFGNYQPPRFADVPELDVHLINRPDIASAGAGESPIMGVGPAVANAVFHATGVRIRQMPVKLGA